LHEAFPLVIPTTANFYHSRSAGIKAARLGSDRWGFDRAVERDGCEGWNKRRRNFVRTWPCIGLPQTATRGDEHHDGASGDAVIRLVAQTGMGMPAPFWRQEEPA
jgi:hypothetical protein